MNLRIAELFHHFISLITYILQLDWPAHSYASLGGPVARSLLRIAELFLKARYLFLRTAFATNNSSIILLARASVLPQCQEKISWIHVPIDYARLCTSHDLAEFSRFSLATVKFIIQSNVRQSN